jgi:hypothetical protein
MSFLSVRNGIPVGVSPHLAIIGALIVATNRILTETGDYFVTETGGYFILES